MMIAIFRRSKGYLVQLVCYHGSASCLGW